jgi:Protein of unknown function (DUF2867)
VRVDPGEYEELPLRAHALLADAPLHDVWRLDLPGGGPGRDLRDVRALLEAGSLGRASPALALLFGLRRLLGRLFGWDREPAPDAASEASYLARVDPELRRQSLAEPGRREGLFRLLYLLPGESVGEIRNATVHAFSVFAWLPQPRGYRLYWAIHVRPVGRITAWYMRLIDPFRRWIVYPTLLSRLRRRWEAGPGRGEPGPAAPPAR